MLYMRPMCDSHSLLLASYDLLGKDLPHFPILLEARFVLVFVVLWVIVVQIVCFLAEDADLRMVLVWWWPWGNVSEPIVAIRHARRDVRWDAVLVDV